VLNKRLNPSRVKRKEARKEVYDILSALIDRDEKLDINHRELSRLVRSRGISPVCKMSHCMIQESATAISTFPINRPDITIRSSQADESRCDCQWAYLAGFLSK